MMDGLKPYPEMKDSGVEWLDDVPTHWEIQQLKRLTKFLNGIAFKPSDWKDSGVPIIRIENLNGGNIFNYTDRTDLPCRMLIQTGDLVFAWSGNRGTSFGPFEWTHDFSGYLNQHIFKLEDYWLDRKYFFRLLRAVTKHVEDNAHGIIGLVHITKPALGAIRVPVAPPDEQIAIARFLDHADRRIRRYIRAKERLIALLEEQKQAIIQQAVTGQIDVCTGQPYPAYKPSGIEWLGNVPEHWEVRRLKTICNMKSGETITSELIESSGEYPVYGGNGQRGYTSHYTHDGQYVLIGRQGALCGNVHVVSGQFWASEHAVVATLHRGHVVDWFGAVLDIMNLNQHSIAAAQPGLAVERILNLFLPVPDIEEQTMISINLNMRIAKSEATVIRTRRQIDLLREYRTRLIADVVTGKLDVRKEAVQIPDEDDEEWPEEDSPFADDLDE